MIDEARRGFEPTPEGLRDMARRTAELRWRTLCADEDGLTPIVSQELMAALAHLQLAETTFEKAAIWQSEAIAIRRGVR